MYKKKNREKIVITGSSGYIGSILSKNLSKKYLIYLLDKKKPQIKINGIFIKLDLTKNKKVFEVLSKINPKIIVHLAAQSTIDMISKKKKSYKLNNINATKNIVDTIKKINTVSLNSVLKNTETLNIDYLSIDVEGHEMEVLKGFDIIG